MVASAISDETVLEARNELDALLYGVFSDADGDALTVSAGSSNTAAATVSVTSDYGTLTVTGVAEGTATITVTARDADGNRVSDASDVSEVKAPEPDPAAGAGTDAAGQIRRGIQQPRICLCHARRL